MMTSDSSPSARQPGVPSRPIGLSFSHPLSPHPADQLAVALSSRGLREIQDRAQFETFPVISSLR